MHPNNINEDVIQFLDKNINDFPGKSGLKFCLGDERLN